MDLFANPRTPSSIARDERATSPPRSSRVPGMGFTRELLLALIMAVAMAATVLLYR